MGNQQQSEEILDSVPLSSEINSEPLDQSSLSIHDSDRVRGRTMERPGSVDRSTTRRIHHLEHASTGGEGHISRISSRKSSAEPEAVNNLSITTSATPPTGFEGHRDSFALILLAQKRRGELPRAVFQRMLLSLDHPDYLSLRLVCRQWSDAVSQCQPPKIPSVFYSPTEILHQILGHLSPVDFNSARHTSKAWMVASLDKKLLNTMIKRGGWNEASQEDSNRRVLQEGQGPLLTDEWVLSKRLATECMLSADWKGNGISNSPRFSISTTIDFSDLANGYNADGGAAVNFTVSGCGNYGLVAEGCVVYIYQLLGADACRITFTPPLRPVTSIICPRRVLAVSMDTSAQRFAIAALLEGRMGLVCDIHIVGDTNRPTRAADDPPLALMGRSIAGQTEPVPGENPTFQRATVRSTSSYGERTITEPATSNFTNPVRPSRATSPYSRPTYSDTQTTIPEHGIAVENGARSIYRNLCSNEDPPRSVAICPQRRCVAFGCSAGIELHWVDALTGQDLNRWFPLAAPSDFLYFLPPRRGVDSAKKLRLISSAAHPHERASILNRFHPPHPAFFVNIPVPLPPNYSSTSLRAVDCDHYRAVPLSDGYHMLFTDPTSGLLCLGSDAPLGGPTKLLRRIMMVPPSSVPQGMPPSVYASGTDLRWGVRVAAAYGDKIVFYSIPSDIFEDAKADKVLSTGPDETNENDLWHDYYHSTSPAPGTDPVGTGLWPVQIEGFEIGRMDGIVDFAVVAGPSVSVWAFCGRRGEAIVWDMATKIGLLVNKAVICLDGGVVGLQDKDGDIHMEDTPQHETERCHSFDGADAAFPNRSTNVVHLLDPGPGPIDTMDDGSRSTTHLSTVYGDSLTLGVAHVAEITGSSPFDLQIPSLEQGWDGEGDGADEWLMQYLGHATDDEALRIMGFETLDLEVLSSVS